ncbi:uncharacterized protein J8A68_003851 [[Candida] subhashii]|uniref:RING-type E3 ubiquitin transferase n=1 Tax=[Candida] subhashii TaxID=561895 RepID=A0A8J5UGR2_9ASCO|nr:uncharacterized protein J8A68_003851 [[Candida] subhashii]KAG7662643.1 hypothetical protein J8A68_003851 [[Candida] subhashii]
MTPLQPEPTRSIFQPKLVLICSAILFSFFLINQKNSSHLDLEDALYLTKNSIREFKDQHFPDGTLYHPHPRRRTLTNDSRILESDIDYPLNNVVNSFFPIDAIISYNRSTTTIPTFPTNNITTHELISRYASFSPVLNYNMISHYRILPHNACTKFEPEDPEELEGFKNKVIIVLRGDCTFVDKVTNVLESKLDPTCIIIANDEPYRGLITMFSNNFNQDGSLRTPILFITNEDFMTLSNIESEDLPIGIRTAYIGSWLSIILSMVLSPPLLIIFFYSMIVCGQRIRRRQINMQNAKMVKQLPVYIFNIDHLILAPFFQKYLKVTGQTNMVPRDSETTDLYESPKPSRNGSSLSIHKITVGGIDVRSSKDSLHVITAPDDFYPAYKCSICLEKYIPLKSKLLVLECKHFFHEKCLSNWLINFRRSCPLCNSTLTKPNCTYLLGSDDEIVEYGSTNDLEAGVLVPFFDPSPSQEESLESEDDIYSDGLFPVGSSSRELSVTRSEGNELHSVVQNEEIPPPVIVGPSSGVSETTDMSFFTPAQSPPLPADKLVRPPPVSATHSFRISKPSQILSRFSGREEENESEPGSKEDSRLELSVSIDSGDFVSASEEQQLHQDSNSIESSGSSNETMEYHGGDNDDVSTLEHMETHQ